MKKLMTTRIKRNLRPTVLRLRRAGAV